MVISTADGGVDGMPQERLRSKGWCHTIPIKHLVEMGLSLLAEGSLITICLLTKLCTHGVERRSLIHSPFRRCLSISMICRLGGETIQGRGTPSQPTQVEDLAGDLELLAG